MLLKVDYLERIVKQGNLQEKEEYTYINIIFQPTSTINKFHNSSFKMYVTSFNQYLFFCQLVIVLTFYVDSFRNFLSDLPAVLLFFLKQCLGLKPGSCTCWASTFPLSHISSSCNLFFIQQPLIKILYGFPVVLRKMFSFYSMVCMVLATFWLFLFFFYLIDLIP